MIAPRPMAVAIRRPRPRAVASPASSSSSRVAKCRASSRPAISEDDAHREKLEAYRAEVLGIHDYQNECAAEEGASGIIGVGYRGEVSTLPIMWLS